VDFVVLTIPGCPNSDAARHILAQAMALEGLKGTVSHREVTTDDKAIAFDFHGSPTFRAAGQDLFPSAGAPALSCRLYRDGMRSGGVPSLNDLRTAVRAVLPRRTGPTPS
jgi:hypothetical protein